MGTMRSMVGESHSLSREFRWPFRSMLMEHAAQYRSLGAPTGDGQKLIDPPYSALPGIVAENRQLLVAVDYDMQGRALADISASARRALVTRAVAYTRQYRDVPQRWNDAGSLTAVPFILSGHQPQLFHPGVWYKNFVLGRLARELRGVGVHLLIDSDMCRGVSIRVPSGSVDEPRVEAVAYDAPSAEVPYEERTIRDMATLTSFPDRVVALLSPLVERPLVESLWPLALGRNSTQMNLGLRLAQGRHALEETWHNDTLELPQSAVCQLPEFAWFLAHVLAQLPRFWATHNDALAAYRRSLGLRNRAQPIPDLAESDGWLEAPFWIWTNDDPRRRPLFAQQNAGELVISDRHQHRIKLTLSDDTDATAAVEHLLALSARGVKIRTRALTTTLFARMVLGDLFLHGIGGARYDQVTDQIIRGFFECTPPEFAAVSATLRLPIANRPAETQNGRHWQQQLRDLRYHPERFLDSRDTSTTEHVAAKKRWVQTEKTPQNARERHQAIAAANKSLQPYVEAERRKIEWEHEETDRRQRSCAILDSRDYSFCLFPRTHFEKLLLDDAAPTP